MKEIPGLELWTRKKVAEILDISMRSVTRNEKKMGLVRVRINSRIVKYRSDSVLDVIKSH